MKIRAVRVLLPGTRPSGYTGAQKVAIKFAELLNKIVPTEIWTYKTREEGTNFLDLKNIPEDEDIIWIVAWGLNANHLLNILKKRKAIYFAQAAKWRIIVPISIPILCGSHFIMAYWAQKAPHNPIYLYKHIIDKNCRNANLDRDIDVLYIRRKSTAYLKDVLITELQKHCNVYISKKFVPKSEVFKLYNRSKVYLYSSELIFPLVEGFGLQPLEAMVCGCTVFSNLKGGLSDYLDPGICGNKLETYSKEYDIKRILEAVNSHTGHNPNEKNLLNSYSEEGFYKRMAVIWPEIVKYLEFKDKSPPSSWSKDSISSILSRFRF